MCRYNALLFPTFRGPGWNPRVDEPLRLLNELQRFSSAVSRVTVKLLTFLKSFETINIDFSFFASDLRVLAVLRQAIDRNRRFCPIKLRGLARYRYELGKRPHKSIGNHILVALATAPPKTLNHFFYARTN